MLKLLILILSLIAICLLYYVFNALCFWGLGCFIIWTFKLTYMWTFWHGLVVAILFSLLKDIFKKEY